MKTQEAVKILKDWDRKNKHRDTGRLKNAVGIILQEMEYRTQKDLKTYLPESRFGECRTCGRPINATDTKCFCPECGQRFREGEIPIPMKKLMRRLDWERYGMSHDRI